MNQGILYISKPKNKTSRDVVNQISKIYGIKKVGHTGTLDPIATGVMIVCLGNYTKLVPLLTSLSKTYVAVMELGIETDTLDCTGNLLKKEEVFLSEDEIREKFCSFPRKYLQEVPIYSAVKVNGKKLYEYARNHIPVSLPKKEVEIYSLKILNIENNKITFETCVSKGTYIRSLIRDLAQYLGTVGVMNDLIRIKQGSVSITECHFLEDISKETPLKKLEDVFSFPIIEVEEKERKKIENGNSLKLNSKEEKIFVSLSNKVVAIYQKEKEDYRMVFKVI